MKYLSLFTGYGGLDLALQHIGEPIAYVEIEEYAQKIIAYRMADGSLKRAPILADVKNVRGSVGVCDLIVGGFPCQDLSVAGNRKGLEGERSGLFFEIIRLTKEIRPAFVFLENVEGIRTKGLREVVRAFTDLGYDFRWTRVSAKEVGANHKRNRWFGLAYSASSRPQERRPVGIGQSAEKSSAGLESESERCSIMADTSGSLGSGLSSGEGTEYSGIRSTSEHIFRNDWWAVEPNVGRVANGTPFRVDRLKALGNGVVPLQARTAFHRLIGVE